MVITQLSDLPSTRTSRVSTSEYTMITVQRHTYCSTSYVLMQYIRSLIRTKLCAITLLLSESVIYRDS